MRTFAAIDSARVRLPTEWKVRDLKRVAQLKENQNVDAGAVLLSLRNTGELTPRGENVQPPSIEYIPRYWLVDEGDLVVNPMWLAGGSIGVSRVSGAVSPDYRVYELSSDLEPRYIHHLLRSAIYGDQYRLLMRAETTFDRRVTKEDFGGLPLILPPLVTQRFIADFLDAETARIDALIEKKQRMIDLLRERWIEARRHAVVRGLETGVTLRKTGGPWLDEVPTQWRTSKLHHLGVIRGGMTPSTEQENYWDGDIPWVSPKDMKQFDLVSSTDHVTPHALAETALSLIEPESVLFVVRGMILARTFPVALNGVTVALNQDMKALRPESDDARYLAHMLAGMSDAVLALLVEESAHGTRVLRMDRWKEFPLFIPPVEEQCLIARHLDAENARVTTTTSQIESQLSLLRERRQALISAAVTGQLNIARAAA